MLTHSGPKPNDHHRPLCLAEHQHLYGHLRDPGATTADHNVRPKSVLALAEEVLSEAAAGAGGYKKVCSA